MRNFKTKIKNFDTFWENDTTILTLSEVIDMIDSGIEIDPKQIEHLLIKTKRDPIRVKNANLDYPIILTKSKGSFLAILDGQHRVVKALKNNLNVRAKVLDLDLLPKDLRDLLINN